MNLKQVLSQEKPHKVHRKGVGGVPGVWCPDDQPRTHHRALASQSCLGPCCTNKSAAQPFVP